MAGSAGGAAAGALIGAVAGGAAIGAAIGGSVGLIGGIVEVTAGTLHGFSQSGQHTARAVAACRTCRPRRGPMEERHA